MLRFPLWKVGIILLVIIWGGLLALPNLLSEQQRAELPGFLPSSSVNLGLDLRGGAYLRLELEETDIATGELQAISGDIEREFLRRPRIPNLRDIIGNELVVNVRDDAEMERARTSIEQILRSRQQEQAGFTIKDALLWTAILLILGGVYGAWVADWRSVAGWAVIAVGVASGVGWYVYDDNRVGNFELTQTDNGYRVSLREEALATLNTDARNKSMEVVRRRVDPTGTAEISVIPEGADRIVLEVPGENNTARIKDILSQAGQLEFSLVDDDRQNIAAAQASRPERGWRLLPQPSRPGEPFLLVRETPIMTGGEIQSANQAFDAEDGSPIVSFRLDGRGTEVFGEASSRNVRKRFAIILDDVIISAPTIITPILTGSGQITMGSADNMEQGIREARDLAAIIEAGELPAKLNVIEERVVGAGLGEDSIRAGTVASIIGLILVAVFMILIYGLFGIFAVGSLAINIVLILGALSGLGATLTLPGIAGIILTIGMAVDANVLVFERVREEQRNGRSPNSALEKGYESALSTIMDANITTLIAAAVLFQLGSGPVKGFAVTLGIGIFSSVFTAFVVTRWFSASWLRFARPKKLPV